MAKVLKEVDAVIVGLGWTGGILAKELAEAGLSVVALERGAMRDPSKDYALPNIRDERVKDNMGALEVWNSKESKWEDLPFMVEGGQWKLAIGEMWANTWKSPGKGRDQIEKEAANALKGDRKSTRLNSSHTDISRMPSSA